MPFERKVKTILGKQEARLRGSSQRKKVKNPRARVDFYLRQTAQTHAGNGVKHLVATLRGKNVLEKISNMGHIIAKMPVHHLPLDKLKIVYGRRSAEKIIADNVIYIKHKRTPGPEITGCVDHAIVAIAGLRAMGIPAKFIRWAKHSMARFEYEGKQYFFDPFNTAIYHEPPVREIVGEEKKALERSGTYYEGLDANHVGIDFEHFDKPSNPKTRVIGHER